MSRDDDWDQPSQEQLLEFLGDKDSYLGQDKHGGRNFARISRDQDQSVEDPTQTVEADRIWLGDPGSTVKIRKATKPLTYQISTSTWQILGVHEIAVQEFSTLKFTLSLPLGSLSREQQQNILDRYQHGELPSQIANSLNIHVVMITGALIDLIFRRHNVEVSSTRDTRNFLDNPWSERDEIYARKISSLKLPLQVMAENLNLSQFSMAAWLVNRRLVFATIP